MNDETTTTTPAPTPADAAERRAPAEATLRPTPQRPPLRITCDCGHD